MLVIDLYFSPISVVISGIGGRGLAAATRQRCAAALRRTGFAVLRGASLFAEAELQAAQRTATAELRRVQKATEEPRKSGRRTRGFTKGTPKTMKSHGETRRNHRKNRGSGYSNWWNKGKARRERDLEMLVVQWIFNVLC